MPWWSDNKLRMIQCNLRDIDGAMDVDKLISDVRGFHANALMVGAGGITSFFPSELLYQTPSPYLKGDVLGEIVKKGQAAGLRIFARFDFSKTHKRLLADNPDWYYRSAKGEPIFFGDTVQTCVNGYYQRELSLEIIEEVLRKYPVDGIFFNMFGYQTKDYANVYHGICQCEACKRMFMQYSGMALPKTEDASESALGAYRTFQEKTVYDMLGRIADRVQSINPKVAICTYHHHRVDIIRDESNSAVDRPYPFWLYSGSENCQSVEDTWQDKLVSNVAINAVDIFYRFMGVSPHLTRTRLYQSIAAGSGLDWCIIGVFEGYPDEQGYEAAREVFAFHQQNEQYFGDLQSAADIALLRPARGGRGMSEYQGLYKMLKEEHIPFDAIRLDNPAAVVAAIAAGKTIILPDIQGLAEEIICALGEHGAGAIATAGALADAPDALRRLFGVERGENITPIRAGYWLVQPQQLFPSLPKRDWVWADGQVNRLSLRGAQGHLPLVAPAAFGPPERCFGHSIDEDCPGLALYEGQGFTRAYLPWAAGDLYRKHGYEDHKRIFIDALKRVCAQPLPVDTDAPACVELYWNRIGEKRYLLQLINHSGFNGTTFVAPLPLSFAVRLGDHLAVKQCKTLQGEENPLEGHRLLIRDMGLYNAYVIDVD